MSGSVEEAVYIRRRAVVGAYFGDAAAQDCDPTTVEDLYLLIRESPCAGGECRGLSAATWRLCDRCRALRELRP